MSTTRVSCHIKAPRSKIYKTLIDKDAVASWKAPDGMTCRVHEFEAREGGRLRVSLTYDAPTEKGKTSAHTDTYRGRFVELIPNEKIVEVDEFESDDPDLAGPMTTTITLSDDREGTRLIAVHEGVPDGVPPDQNEEGWRMALAKLTALVEGS